MSTVNDSEHPTVQFDETERAGILATAKVRSTQGADFRQSLHPYTDEEAKALNRVGHHIAGEISERAVSAWLDAQCVEHKRPTSLTAELTEKLPDILSTAYAVKLDVKSSFGRADFRANAAQTRESTVDAIVWCKPVRNGYLTSEEYDSHVDEQAQIWGWTGIAEMRKGTQEGDNLVVDDSMVRPLSELIVWVRDGKPPTGLSENG